MLKLFIISLALFFLLTTSAIGQSKTQNTLLVQQYIEQAKSINLDRDPYWLALGRYKKNLLNSHYTSDISSAQFFLAPDGRYSPEKELESTIAEIFKDPKNDSIKDPNLHAQCRFIARFNWLKKKLKVRNEDIPRVECSAYQKWTSNNQIQSVSLIFATGYLGNPASFFGHPLMKFNLANEATPTELLDVSVNYGAVTPDQENPFIYAMKGLFGGYHATFSHRSFFYSNHNYSEVELRDMWDYQLNLTKEEIDQLVNHTWELLGQHFPYYFLDDNCASRMAELLEIIVGTKLNRDYLPWAVPFTFFDNLANKNKQNGQPIITKFTYIPSRQARFRSKFLALEQIEKNAVKTAVKDENYFDKSDYKDLSQDQKIRILDTLFDYNSFIASSQKENPTVSQNKQKYLQQRLQLPAKKIQWPEVQNSPLHQGQKSELTGISYLTTENRGTGWEFRLRPAYYDYLALDFGRPENSSLGIFDFKFIYLNNNFKLQSLDLISVETLNISKTGLPGDGGFAWKLQIGYDHLNLECTRCSLFKLDLGVGQGYEILDKHTFYLMLDIRNQTPTLDSGYFPITPNTGLILKLGQNWKTQLTFGQRHYLDGQRGKENIFKWENRFGESRTWDIRFIYEEHQSRQSKLSYNYYW